MEEREERHYIIKKTMMRKILLFASAYKSSGSANGVCARNLVREFIKQGHEVYVIATPYADEKGIEIIDGAKVWFEPLEWYVRVFNYLQKHHSSILMRFVFSVYNAFRILVFGLFFPNDCRFRVRRLINRAVALIEHYNIDTVIGTCLPYDGIPASICLKKEYGDRLKVVTYHFDIMSVPNNEFKPIVWFKKWKVKSAFTEELRVVDKVLLPHSARGFYDSSKVEYVGLPVYIKDGYVKETAIVLPHNKKNIVYIGSLDSRNRSPLSAIDYVRRLNEIYDQQYTLHVWGKLADAETEELICHSSDCVEYHNLIDNSEVQSVMKQADYLLNISNTILYKLIPSKIFSMFATGKPIINLVSHPDDCTIEYFEKYGNTKRINLYKERENNDYNLELKPQIVVNDNLFEEFTPSYITKALLTKSK